MDDKVFSDAVIATVDQLNLFEPPVVQSAVQKGIIVEYRPTSHLSGSQDAPIHFSLGSDSRNYLDLSKTRLFVKAKLVNQDLTAISANTKVAPVNMTLQSLWSMIEMKVSGKSTNFPTNGCYPYIALLQTLLKNSEDSKSGQLAAQMYFKDDGEDFDAKPELNTGFIARQKMFSESKSVCMEGPLCVDLCSTQRYILANTPIDITLYRSVQDFVIQTKEKDKKFKIVIEDICLKAFFLEVHVGVLAGQSLALERKANAVYPFTRVECKTFNIPSGSRQFCFDNIFNNSYPKRVLCVFVDSDSYSGQQTKNPFNFKHNDLTQIELTADGISVPSRPLTFKFDDTGREIAPLFLKLYDAAGASNNPLFGNGLSLSDFANGNSIFAFPLSGCGLDANHLEVRRSSNVSVQGTFGTALKAATTLIIYSEHPTVAEIDASRNIIIH